MSNSERDHWRAQGAAAERNRILTLIEQGIDFVPFEGLFFAKSKDRVTKEDLLALIKGQNK